jgi:hypothetical protein
MEMTMRNLLWITAAAALMVGGSAAGAAELPTYEIMGFPITPHQLVTIGSGQVQERSPTAPLMAGMPASPHQIAVLTPRPKLAVAAGR